MNKPYFAKWVPVEGEATCTNQNCEGGDGYGSKFKFTHEIAKECINCGSPLKQNTKLFLCSRDIQVGDIVQNDQGIKGLVESIPSESSIQLKVNDQLSIEVLNWFYKVIGEISSEATWVKEGDEFDKDEVEFICHFCGNMENDLDKPHHPECPKEIWCSIKGPCGHYH